MIPYTGIAVIHETSDYESCEQYYKHSLNDIHSVYVHYILHSDGLHAIYCYHICSKFLSPQILATLAAKGCNSVLIDDEI